MAEELMNFDLPVNRSSIIKVLGIGGGGSNAVNHMWQQGIKDVDFVVCNTDAQALTNSPVPVKIQLGESLTEGRGAGSKPDVGRQAAIENLEDVKEILEGNTKMVFITSGMGGGTGTGAAPVIAKAAHDLGILTVAIVTIPFRFEGQQRINQAIEGINQLKEHVDSLLVINNEKLREIYGDLKLSEAFAKADDVLSIAAKGIAEIITVPGYINVDFADVETVMKDSGVAILGTGIAAGEDRATKAMDAALASPLLNNNEITGADNILINITSGEDEVSMDEIGEITDFVSHSAAKNAHIIWGTGKDVNLGDQVAVTVIATGFEATSIPELYIKKTRADKVRLSEPSEFSTDKTNKVELSNSAEPADQNMLDQADGSNPDPVERSNAEPLDRSNVQRTFEFDVNDDQLEFVVSDAEDKTPEATEKKSRELVERVKKLRKSHEKVKEQLYNQAKSNESIDELENEPAYVRKQIQIDDTKPSGESKVSKYSLSEDEDKNSKLREDNAYLHDNVD